MRDEVPKFNFQNSIMPMPRALAFLCNLDTELRQAEERYQNSNP